ncbi:MAG: TatD family hydrolase [Actinomycetia bacterium]|nr:TatD family hydrolase [Actinomycetes bacterium]
MILDELKLPPLPAPLPAPTTDAHTHLESVRERSALPVAESLALARQVGVTRVVDVGVDEASSRRCVEIASTYPCVVANVALHPNEVARHPELVEAGLAAVAEMATSPYVRGVGETGLDYFRTTDPADQARQREVFAAQIEIAVATGQTLVIHDRDAHDDLLDVLDGCPKPDRVVMHCFSGDADHARRCLDRGCYLSFPGVTTYPANRFLREALAVTPADRVLAETDAPYLTPVPQRGRPNASYLLPHTVAFLADQRGWDLAEACQQLRRNTFEAFGGPWGDD